MSPRTVSPHYGAKTGSMHSTAGYARRAPSHAPAYAYQHRLPPSQNRYSSPATYHPTTGQQRLARVHIQPERVQEIQQALIREGYLRGDATGQWDSQTHEAMQRYQTDHGFPNTGLPEAKSLMKLGLGSHPLAPELDHGPVGVATPGAAQGDLSANPPVSQAVPLTEPSTAQ